MRTAVLGPDLGDAVDAGFELGLSLPELREGRGEMGEFLGGWVMGENSKQQQQQQQHAHVVQLLLDVSKLGNVEIANPDRLRWWRRRHVGHTVTLPLSFPPKPCQSLKIWACLSACRSDLPFSPFLLFVCISCHVSCLLPSHTRKCGRLVTQGQPWSVSNTHIHI